MKKIQTVPPLDECQPSFPMGTGTVTQNKMLEKNFLEENLKKTRSMERVWIDDCFLSPEDFRMELRREKRRVERSAVPMSIVLLELQESVLNNQYQLKQLLHFLRAKTRETDIKGWVHSKAIGLIFLDTNDTGLKKCVDLIVEANGDGLFSVVMGTYPDSLFEELLDETKAEPDFFLHDLDQASEGQTFSLFFKRGLDLFGALVGLLLFSPLMALTALAIKVSSPGPVIFKQIRLGRKGKRFPFYKFRSMEVNNDDRVHREYLANLIEGKHEALNSGKEDEPFFKIKNDTRITRVGRIIRKLSIDELPQFLNVLKGEMSLVGPRPPILYEVEKYKSWHLRRILEVKPGITGLWQVDGRSRTSFDDMVRLDLRYVKDWSFWMDIKILLKTVSAVLKTKGAA
jgi:exopolysaccharide biosynthesis polyprenyl glycosylphosphotransferase